MEGELNTNIHKGGGAHVWKPVVVNNHFLYRSLTIITFIDLYESLSCQIINSFDFMSNFESDLIWYFVILIMNLFYFGI